MSKTLNDERRIDARRRESVKTPSDPVATPPVSIALPPGAHEPTPACHDARGEGRPAAALATAGTEPTAVSTPRPNAEPSPQPTPTVSRTAAWVGHHWYSALTFFIAFGMTLGVVRIVRTGPPRAPLTTPVPAPAEATLLPDPPALVSTTPSLSVEPLPPAPPAQRTHDPFVDAVSPESEDTALAEATHAYHLMEAALRDAAKTLPALQPNPSASTDPIRIPERN